VEGDGKVRNYKIPLSLSCYHISLMPFCKSERRKNIRELLSAKVIKRDKDFNVALASIKIYERYA
jgi:hypothetical protein